MFTKQELLQRAASPVPYGHPGYRRWRYATAKLGRPTVQDVPHGAAAHARNRRKAKRSQTDPARPARPADPDPKASQPTPPPPAPTT